MKYKVVVTFNGSNFDLKHTKILLGVDWSGFVHLDLFYQLDDHGYTKGLKYIKKVFKINNQMFEQINGVSAPIMW